jgi:hypothetical protein
MATAAEDLQPGDDEDQNLENAEEQSGEDQEAGHESPYAPLAREMGWVPKSEFRGDDANWKDAEDYIRVTNVRQKEASRELKNVRSQMDVIAKTTASIVEQQVKERVDQLAAQHAKAVEDGDPAAAFKISREIDQALTASPQNTAPPPEAQDFAARNKAWFNVPGHEYETSRAIAITNQLAAQGYDPATQLRVAEQQLRREAPHLFQQSKPAPGVHAPGSRSSGSRRQKGWADMPPESQRALQSIIDRNPAITKEMIAINYFSNLEKKA